MSDAPILTVHDLSVAFQGEDTQLMALERASFTIARGKTLALVGESGSGKSVCALSIMQLLPYPAASHPSGTITFDGQELMGAPEQAMRKVRGGA